MKQAEKLLDDLGWSKAVLEIQYEHEVHVQSLMSIATVFQSFICYILWTVKSRKDRQIHGKMTWVFYKEQRLQLFTYNAEFSYQSQQVSSDVLFVFCYKNVLTY